MKNIIISIELATRIVNYLAAKPYGEVTEMIAQLHEAAKIEPKKEE